MKELKPNTKPTPISFNKPAYAIFMLVEIFFLVRKDFSQAVIFLGLALVFDPFKTDVPFAKRPFYQQAWLIVHLSITFALFILMFVKD